ncbi:putative LPS assembly protein LptD [Maribellus maritimus]|uniref:putative LPS assembly protein LptD n=1 Tax=Maribellus maritimus TaxID=2870838 RepID=UPI001EE9B017|nr:putative LPS assembly protein LptD [Maribellus maritimus]MCG6187627.1 LPS-assembly protein LptD [Maribellus maritimus]
MSLFVFGQETDKNVRLTNLNQQDTTFTETPVQDTLAVDTIEIDSIVPPVIEAPIDYNAEDSIIVSFDGQKVFLYNNAHVTYQQIELTAYYIELDLETKEVYAEGLLDSTETLIQKPVFRDGDEEFESKTLRYNFETKKGIITQVVTEQGEGYFHSERTKKISDDAFLATDGKYTTCDADHPHFYLHLSKAKVISNNKIITGPAYMVLEDFPIYFPFLPFGYFPSTPTYSSGIIVPTYGEEANRGFYLRDGGYYWAAGQYFDLALRGDIYSKGSWAGKLNTNYRKRYKFNGNFDFKYNVNTTGERGTDTYGKSNQFAISWRHSQDAKANPNQTFSASVNFSTSGYDKQNSLTADTYLRTQKQSSVSYTKKFENTPFNMSVNLRHSQNSTDSTISLTLPEMTFSMAKVYPFRKKNRAGPVRWYEKFGVNYSGNLRNALQNAKEWEVMSSSFTKDWKNGIKHNLPISLPSFNLFNYVNFSPSFSYNEKWYFKKMKYTYVPGADFEDNPDRIANTVRIDTLTGLNRVYDYSYSVSASTNIYGMFSPLNPDSKVQAIRHKMTPSVSLSYTPDFGQEKFGYYQPVQVDSAGTIRYYDVNYGGIYGGSPGQGASGAVSFSLNNSLEMKVLDVRDTTKSDEEQKYRKVKLIDNLSFSTSYNLVADSFNLSPVAIRARTTIAGVSINAGTTLDPYILDEDGRVNKYAWSEKKGFSKFGRFTQANLSFGLQFKSKKGEEQAQANKEAIEEENILPGDYSNYADFNVPWDFNIDYSINYRGPNYLGGDNIVTQTLGFRGNLNLTEKWRMSMTTNFDIMAREFSFTTFNITRDLHCWQMVFNFIPFGQRRSYSFTINARSSLLKDLKLTKNRSYFDNY